MSYLDQESKEMSGEVVAVAEKVVLEPDEDWSYRRRPRSRLRSRSAEQLTYNHNRHHHHRHHHHHHQHRRQYHSDNNIHYHHHNPRQHHHHRRHHSQHSESMSHSWLRREDSVDSRSSRYSSDPDLPEILRSEMTLNLSLCGCGFLGIYHLGVASCLVKHGQRFLARLDRVAGASAGALAAAILVTAPTPRHVEISVDMLTNVARKIRRKPFGALTPGFQLTNQVARLLDKILPLDAHELARGRLFVSLTNAKSHQNEVFTDFKSRDELIQALVASCHIPVYSGVRSPTLRGEHYYDGGLSDNLLRFDDGRTVTVSPFSGKQDIGPHDALTKGTKGNYFNLHNQDLQLNFNNVRRFSHAFFPPRRHVLQQYLELGHKDASRFLIKEGLYEIHKPGDKKPLVYESSV